MCLFIKLGRHVNHSIDREVKGEGQDGHHLIMWVRGDAMLCIVIFIIYTVAEMKEFDPENWR